MSRRTKKSKSTKDFNQKEEIRSVPNFAMTKWFHLSTGQAILEIRRRAGLNWDQLNELFNDSRRNLIQWANGAQPTEADEEHIWKTLSVIRDLDEGVSRKLRKRLLEEVDGVSYLDLLKVHRYEDIPRPMNLRAAVVPASARGLLSAGEWELRRPPPPHLLVGAIQDRPDIPVGRVRTTTLMKKSLTGDDSS